MSIFSKVPKHRPRRNVFNLSYPNQFSMKTGLLYPLYMEETCPGDIFHAGTGVVIRSQPTLAPLFTNYRAEVRYFYIPNRLVWDGFKEFMMHQQENVKGIVDPKRVHPFIAVDPLQDVYIRTGSLADFLGVPEHCREPFNALPFRAYNLVWNEYFRDQNLQDSLDVVMTDGEDDITLYELRRVNWKKDYFTSALPWTQRGRDVDLSTLVKLRDFGDIERDGFDFQYVKTRNGANDDFANAIWFRNSNAASVLPGGLRVLGKNQVGQGHDSSGNSSGAGPNILSYTAMYDASNLDNNNTRALSAYIDPAGTLGVDINIRDLRFASAVQKFLEKEAQVGGGRYADWIRGVYGVNIGDATLQRPLYLGGGSQDINISPVEQTSSTNEVSPQGTLAGKGYMSSLYKMNRPTLLAEHGWVIGVLYIRPRPLYYRGLNRHLSKESRFDYLIPGFQHLGEQEILNKEVYPLTFDVSASAADKLAVHQANNETWGYTSRQAEYKSHSGEIHGEVKTNLHQYVVARDFADHIEVTPPLNSSFVTCDPDEDTVFAVSPSNADSWIVDGYNVCQVQRDLDKFPSYGL